MNDDKKKPTVRCPKCDAIVAIDAKAERDHVATCPNGHRVELVKMID